MALKSSKPKTAGVTGYCVKCKEKKLVQGGAPVTKNGRRRHAGGKCGDCGTGMSVMLGAKAPKE